MSRSSNARRATCWWSAAPPTTPTACSANCWRPACEARGVKGLVIDAGCRDVKALKEMGFPVWSKAISAKGTVKATLGAVNVPVVCAGVNVEPGDAVVADDDGVVIVPKKWCVETAQKAQKRTDDEDGKRQQLAGRRARPRHVQDARAAGEGRAASMSTSRKTCEPTANRSAGGRS